MSGKETAPLPEPEVTEEIWGPDTVPVWEGKVRSRCDLRWHNELRRGVNRKGNAYQFQTVWPVGYQRESKLDLGSETAWGEKLLTVWEREPATEGPRFVAELKLEEVYQVVCLRDFEDLLAFAREVRPLVELRMRQVERAEWEEHYSREHQREFDSYCPLCWRAREQGGEPTE